MVNCVHSYRRFEMKECVKCGEAKPLVQFRERPTARDPEARRNDCRGCETKGRKTRKNYGVVFGQALVRKNAKKQDKNRRQRRDPAFRAKHIHEDSRRYDRKRGLENNLSIEIIDDLIAKGCSYCGEHEISMTLDRIDNKLGHTLDNVVPACYRCNLIRGSMPYPAWLNLIDAVRDAREKGLFGTWTGGG